MLPPGGRTELTFSARDSNDAAACLSTGRLSPKPPSAGFNHRFNDKGARRCYLMRVAGTTRTGPGRRRTLTAEQKEIA